MDFRKTGKRILFALVGASLLSVLGVIAITIATLQRERIVLPGIDERVSSPEVLARDGTVLRRTYANEWNVHDHLPLERIPGRLIEAVICAEDRRFFDHSGQDWLARAAALVDNLRAGRVVRGASTISEQVVRMVRPRPRSAWSRWIEGWQAVELEREAGKPAVLEFYLNQVPYAANRRGVSQAAKHYFDRDLSTLDAREIVALAVLIRAPSRLDPISGDETALRKRMQWLTTRLGWQAELKEHEEWLQLKKPALDIDASHFLRFLLQQEYQGEPVLRSTLDAELQNRTQLALETQLSDLKDKGANHAAALVANHRTGEILAWVVAPSERTSPGSYFDTVQTPRQPGSTLKPFLYALSLEHGWSAATPIKDEPVEEASKYGLHAYRNYSSTFYGSVTLREALGNSLNIPAIKTIQFVGVSEFLGVLLDLGFHSLQNPASTYGNGLALGNGEVSLLELVTAYGALANRGRYREFTVLVDESPKGPERQVFSPEVASLVADILSDDAARRLEFPGGLLDFPVETAVKTGTSSDFRDAWAVGFDSKYVAGVWIGDLSGVRMDGITGARGPMLVLRSTFDALNASAPTRRLWRSPNLELRRVCVQLASAYDSRPDEDCTWRHEYFLPGTVPEPSKKRSAHADSSPAIALVRPTPGLRLALDPRIPKSNQRFEFKLDGVRDSDLVEWMVDRQLVAAVSGPRYLWPLSRGEHTLSSRVWRNDRLVGETDEIEFVVW